MTLVPQDLTRHVGKFYGKYSGVVVDNADPEKRGHLKVRVDSVFGADTVVRARPCLPTGHFYVPDPQTRIWVEFEAGDTRFPIWVGIWYPVGKTPAEGQVDPPTHRVIQTPSNHTIELSDESGKEKIVIRHKTNSFVSIDADGSVLISNQNGSNLFLNAKQKQATLMGQQGHLVTMTDKALVLANDGGCAVELKGDTVTVLGKNIVLSGASVALGVKPTDPTIMGTAFKALWDLLATHTHPTAMGPSGPATPPILPLQPGVHLTTSVSVK